MSLQLSIEEQRHLLNQAIKAATKAYAPYSQFKVGAAVWYGADETVVSGANIENVSYGLTACAERVAIASGRMAHTKPWKAIAVATLNQEKGHVMPCGACRQVLAEFATPKSVVITSHPVTGEPEMINLTDLLPAAFTL